MAEARPDHFNITRIIQAKCAGSFVLVHVSHCYTNALERRCAPNTTPGRAKMDFDEEENRAEVGFVVKLSRWTHAAISIYM